MPVLVSLITISLAFYVFYKTKYIRSNRQVEKKWLSAKSKIALGLFIALFGVNQLFLFHTTVTYIIAAIFIILGGSSVWTGIKMYKHYLPFAIQEAEMLKNQK
ncbi:MAG: YtpI family protein [Bacillota bacterium]|nr:YtpI family protein [Bacillota bacterium]